jgi:hypothetical protein
VQSSHVVHACNVRRRVKSEENVESVGFARIHLLKTSVSVSSDPIPDRSKA